jgi:hypothetical protein
MYIRWLLQERDAFQSEKEESVICWVQTHFEKNQYGGQSPGSPFSKIRKYSKLKFQSIPKKHQDVVNALFYPCVNFQYEHRQK